MPSAVIKNWNSYSTVAEADVYLDNSARATAWSGLDDDSKARALITATRLIDKQCLLGTKGTNLVVSAVVVAGGGSGYAVNDLITPVGGTAGEVAQFKVTSVSSGAITGLQIINAGHYTVMPSNPVSVTGGTGIGATLTLTSTTQTLQFARDPDTFIPVAVTNGMIELAYEISQDPTIEAADSTATNLKRAKAGSAEVEFFRPGGPFGTSGATRFPAIVMEWLGQFFCGASGSTMGGIVSGTDAESQFDDCDGSGLTQGLP